MKRLIFAIVSSSLLFTSLSLPAFFEGWERGPWEREETRDGLTIYLNEEADEDVPAIRVDGIVDAPPRKVFEMVVSHERARNQSDIVEYKILETSEDGFRTYQRVDPSGIGPRDFVIEGEFIRPRREGGAYALRIRPSKRGPAPKEGVVRVDTVEGVFALEPADGGKKTRVSYRSLFDPEVSLPTFIYSGRLVDDAVSRVKGLQRDARD